MSCYPTEAVDRWGAPCQFSCVAILREGVAIGGADEFRPTRREFLTPATETRIQGSFGAQSRRPLFLDLTAPAHRDARCSGARKVYLDAPSTLQHAALA